MKTALIAAALVAAAVPALAQDDTAFDPAATTFTGWVRVSQNEFQLYPEQRQLEQPFSRPCVSGVLPREQQVVATDLTGAKVRFTGRAVSWDENERNDIVRHEGARISNVCGGEYVIEADSLTVLR